VIERVAVIVPAADEQERIAECLVAIERARRQLFASKLGVTEVDVIVVLDGCRDRTPAIVARFAARSHVHAITSTARRVGAARQQGGLRAIATPARAKQLWLANTDADSTVPRDWLVRMVTAANAGAHLVLGTVLPSAELPLTLRVAWLDQHDLREGHPYVHGANLGIRADTYLTLGGWRSELRCDEDTDLARRAEAMTGVKIVRTAAIPVLTSARLNGRAPDGFSSYLRHLSADSNTGSRSTERTLRQRWRRRFAAAARGVDGAGASCLIRTNSINRQMSQTGGSSGY
jgi:glycosyltransferase involved in cell wall biosynthesis